jgi:hypothetical protein
MAGLADKQAIESREHRVRPRPMRNGNAECGVSVSVTALRVFVEIMSCISVFLATGIFSKLMMMMYLKISRNM